MYKVMIRDNMSPAAKDILEATNKIEVVVDNDKRSSDPKILSQIVREFDGIAIRSGTRITREVLDKAENLKVIGRAGVGIDNIDYKEATRKGIVVMNAPGGNSVTTAEHAISMILSLSRSIPQATASLRAGRWEKKQLIGTEITGKTLGIIGFGQIGRIVAKKARGLEMKVIAADPFVSQDAAADLHVELVTLSELYSRADFISMHVPRLKETENMINRDSLAQMKTGVRLINCSRGEVVNLEDLIAAIDSGRLAGAALDVFPQEPPPADLPILQHPKVIFTPHLGASTSEAQEKVATMIANQIAAYLIDGIISNAVNFPSVSRKVIQKIQPHLNLSEKMGALMGQLIDRAYHVTIQYTGEVARLDTKPLTHAILKGYLSAFSDAPVNYVNSLALASEKGIKVKEEVHREVKDDFAGLIRFQLDGYKEGPDEIWGTIFASVHPRIVRLGRIYMDALPEGYMLVIQNIDKPGVIGNVGTILGRHAINIGRFQLGRLLGRALCMINIDTKADESVLSELSKAPYITSVKQVALG
jgi:D-3-phosphoglycerate dehydrogenase